MILRVSLGASRLFANVHSIHKTKGTFIVKMKSILTLSVAAAFVALPSLSHAQTLAGDTPAVVMLTKSLDAKKLVAGAIIQTKLTDTIHFVDGTKIPGGSMLNATVEKDEAEAGGVKLTLRFTEARLKDGKTIAIKGIILDVSRQPADPSGLQTVMTVPENLNHQSAIVDAVGVVKGVDLHSNVSSDDSGVLVTTTGNDVKLPTGTELELAIAPTAAK
jgi:hypothetical protein